jgi:hypothetical protein
MNLAEALLVVVVIILTVMLIRRGTQKVTTQTETFNLTPKSIKNAVMKKLSPEASAIKEQAEYFTGSSTADSDSLSSTSGFDYAQNNFGTAGGDFKDWVTAQAVDVEVLKNHANFVKDRTATTTQNLLGGTMNVSRKGEFDVDLQTNWIGLRRPQALPVTDPSAQDELGMSNTSQVPDIDVASFSKGPKFTWKST